MSTWKQIGVALLIVGSLSSPASAFTVVETFTSTATISFLLPGTPDGFGGVDFDYTQSFTTINFTPGDVTYLGQPVDFSGTESSWLSTSLTGTINIPVTAGPATVTATGSATASGPALSGADIPTELIALSLGGSFSSSNLDVVLSSSGSYVSGDDLGSTLSASLIPELNGSSISLQGTIP